ncbi:DUF72 domain-containing protein [Sphingomonas sinipercae]|uniref:DUF72 domain-containing protein n=1 Tax=Sphingomonas sinipercae TaxID=2714944 RepID=A0A6G7ZN09_9SPHN|nr:DUF72 domain-containing protein [Sphingomonas sinipercae]QIL02315.1 DUF72 domain-containing protein [Sphingomonas sinipercae]
MTVKIGTAGWAIPRQVADEFGEGTSLQRYATRFGAAEINSSFHRPHRASTWQRWRDSVPQDFRFSVKLPRTVTHQAKLAGCNDLVGDFLEQAHHLGNALAVLLVQLPPKLDFDAAVASAFFRDLRGRTAARIACEPRHLSWFTDQADALLDHHEVARVAADPAICEAAARPGGWRGLAYWRLHGSPVMYRSSYADRIAEVAAGIREDGAPDSWCIFDNTASSAATSDALALAGMFAPD